MIVDLHCHSNASDGVLNPEQLLLRAQDQGVDMLAITDHDTIDGYLAVCDKVAESLALTLVAGVELSCVWGKHTIHIVGLNIDPTCQVLQVGLEHLGRSRHKRALLIGEKLAKYGFEGAYEYALELAAGAQIGRPHFAQFLLDRGHVRTNKEAFKRYLGAGKPGDVKTTWPVMEKVIHWLVASGGVAVLAHPLHYKMTATKLRALITDFKTAGGQAIEVISGNQQPHRTDYLAGLAQQFNLLASVGSDFHRPGMAWNELGAAASLPSSCQPVWSSWQ
ncbi:MAG: PHP domain-containing protein [Spongiibacteraceae bacterium]|nr:PHP domain-containing protein [Spongiibacteraceae bacterium]